MRSDAPRASIGQLMRFTNSKFEIRNSKFERLLRNSTSGGGGADQYTHGTNRRVPFMYSTYAPPNVATMRASSSAMRRDA